jgi:hypothetical protein
LIFEFKGRRLFASLQCSNGSAYGFSLLHRDLGIRWDRLIGVDRDITDGEDIRAVLEPQISADG